MVPWRRGKNGQLQHSPQSCLAHHFWQNAVWNAIWQKMMQCIATWTYIYMMVQLRRAAYCFLLLYLGLVGVSARIQQIGANRCSATPLQALEPLQHAVASSGTWPGSEIISLLGDIANGREMVDVPKSDKNRRRSFKNIQNWHLQVQILQDLTRAANCQASASCHRTGDFCVHPRGFLARKVLWIAALAERKLIELQQEIDFDSIGSSVDWYSHQNWIMFDLRTQPLFFFPSKIWSISISFPLVVSKTQEIQNAEARVKAFDSALRKAAGKVDWSTSFSWQKEAENLIQIWWAE